MWRKNRFGLSERLCEQPRASLPGGSDSFSQRTPSTSSNYRTSGIIIKNKSTQRLRPCKGKGTRRSELNISSSSTQRLDKLKITETDHTIIVFSYTGSNTSNPANVSLYPPSVLQSSVSYTSCLPELSRHQP